MGKYLAGNSRTVRSGNSQLLGLPLFVITVFCFGFVIMDTKPEPSSTAASQGQNTRTSEAPTQLTNPPQENTAHLAPVDIPAPKTQPAPQPTASAPAPPSTPAPSVPSQPTSDWSKAWKKWQEQINKSKSKDKHKES